MHKHKNTDTQNTNIQIQNHTKNTNAEWACRLMMEAPAWRLNARGQDTTARNEFQI